MDNIHTTILKIIENRLTGTPFKLVELMVKPVSKRLLVRAYIDSEQGITIDQCKDFSRDFAQEIDVQNLIENYILEVSSPGVDRPLREDWQFRKNTGRTLTIDYVNGQNIDAHVTGKLDKYENGIVYILLPGKRKKDPEEILELPLDKIKNAAVQLQW
ncbi:hypothetical protein K1X84_06870 [bacterium]|nr:hypothetical protein [bacterium]